MHAFVTGLTPTTDKLDALTAMASQQIAYYAQNGSANAQFGAFEAFGKAMAADASTGFGAKYGAITASEFIASVYQTTYGKAPTDGALANLQSQIDYFTTLYKSAGYTDAQAALDAKGAVLGQIVGYAFMDPVAAESATIDDHVAAFLSKGANGGAIDYGKPLGWTPPPAPPSSGGGGAPAPTGQTFTLKVGPETVDGAAYDDTIKGVAGTGVTYDSSDEIDGGGGIDTLSITTDADFSLIGANLSNVERIEIKNTIVSYKTVVMTSVVGVTDIVNNGSAANGGLAFSDLQELVNLTIDSTLSYTDVIYAAGALAGNTDEMTVNLKNAGSLESPRDLYISELGGGANQLETLNIVTVGINGISLNTALSQTSLSKLVISGAGALSLNFAVSDQALITATTIDASAAGGGVSIGRAGTTTRQLGAADHTVKLGAGDDTVFFGLNLTGADDVDGGGGTDTLGVMKSVADADLANVKNFEILYLDSAAGAVIQDASIAKLAGYNYMVRGANDMTLNGLANDTTTTVAAYTQRLTQALQSDTGADTLTVAFAGGASLNALSDIAGLETLKLASNGSNSNFINTNSVTAKQALTGAADLTISGALQTSEFDASAFTGKLTVKGQATTATTIKGGSGDDTITLGTGADTVTGGGGNDVIQLGAQASNKQSGADTITLGDGNDVVRFVGNKQVGDGAATDLLNFATITDFKIGGVGASDLIAFSGTDTDFSLKTANGATTTTTGLAKGATAQGLAATNAMVVQTIDKDAGAAAGAANVSFFKLTLGVAFGADIKGTFAAAMGTSSVTGLAANGNYVISVYDTTNSKMIVGVVNVGGNADADTALRSNDFVNADIAVVGVIGMSATDYANFGAAQLGLAF